MSTTTFTTDVRIEGDLTLGGTLKPALSPTDLLQQDNKRYKIQPTDWRVWDALHTNLPGTSATDDLALTGGTFGTASPSIQTSDLKAAGSTTRYARCTFQLPKEYVDGQTVTLRARGGMITTVADVAATVDFEVYRSNDEAGIGSDICATAAQSINSLTDVNRDFTITPASLSAGDTLDIRMAVLVNDAATATAVIAVIGAVEFLLDVKA